MPEELRITIVAEVDAAIASLRAVKDGLAGVADTAPAAAGGLSQVPPVADAVEASTVRLSRSAMALSFGLREIGLAGPASFIAMAASATGATIATDTMTVSVLGLEIALGPLLVIVGIFIVAMGGLAITVAAVSAAFGFLGSSARQALDEHATAAAQRLSASLNRLGATVAALKSWVGNALIQMFGPAITQIAAKLQQMIIAFPAWLQGTINALIGWLNKAGNAVVQFINNYIKGLNKIIGFLNSTGLVNIRAIGSVTWNDIGTVTIPPINLSNLGGIDKGAETVKTDVAGGGGGGGAASAGGAGGTGASGARARSPGARDAIEASQDIDRLQLQTLERVDGRMQELIDLLRGLPEMTRDAIVVYTGGQ